MTTQQAEALRLADELDKRRRSLYAMYLVETDTDPVAAKLRRLHESNIELLALLKECIHFVEYDPKNVIGKQAKAAIAKAERTTT